MHQSYFRTIALMLLLEAVCGCRSEAQSQRRNASAKGALQTANSASAASATAKTPARSSEQRFPLRDGRTVVVDPDDHVLVLATDGGVTAESWCGTNGISYRRAVEFLTEVIRLVEAKNKNALAELASFPLLASVPVKNRADFLDHYDSIFPPLEVSAISRADPRAVFCRNGAFMLEDGIIWAEPDRSGAYRLTTVNRAFRKVR